MLSKFRVKQDDNLLWDTSVAKIKELIEISVYFLLLAIIEYSRLTVIFYSWSFGFLLLLEYY